ncbi:MAG: SDR family oxidoreductase [Corynebacterium sp.]|uniref:SDR family oxidoreductase n=1 Tax=unclassified Corynebacterium TaxID=2624378 RepID=UPI00264A0D5A|nr:SDR family oxidoreductase [Corynebacterium sp.]MDN5581965.1 SDR family oxidoreductase [Corynebacterium sp.]MDN5719702.1 SDR family oxidoreductase [Corynebacterium sp.]MDN6258884.1 SDR family oxidoreductase [Corynebacterium sp.]MDN6323926.1 SDR family oxidoreductase [Corynebacterium sp.]
MDTTTGTEHNRPLALVTGGSRGIGAAIVEDLSRTHRVISWSSADVDLSDPASIAQAVERLQDGEQDGLGRLDVLVHSAGLAGESTVGETGWERWQEMFAVNVFGVAELTRLLLPALRAAGGTVVAINSGSGFRSGAAQGPYSGTKFALRAVTDALREEERGRVRVSSVHPGRVDTDMQVSLQQGRGNTDYDGTRYVAPASVAAAVRLAVDTTDEAIIEEVSVRPVRG